MYWGVWVFYLGCWQWSLLKSQEGSWDFHSSFLPSQNACWFWLQADGTAVLSYEETVKDWMSRIVGCIYFVDCIFFFSSPVCLPSLLSPRPLLQQCGLQWHRVFVRGAEWCELRGDGSARALSVCYVRSQAFRPQNPLVRLWLLTGVLLRRTREPSLQFWQHHCSPCDVKSLWCLWKLPTALSKERYFLLSVCFLFCVMWHWGLGWEH